MKLLSDIILTCLLLYFGYGLLQFVVGVAALVTFYLKNKRRIEDQMNNGRAVTFNISQSLFNILPRFLVFLSGLLVTLWLMLSL